MRRIINSTYISLDGVIQDPQDWPDNGIESDGTGMKVQTDLLFGCDALLMGGRTYPGFAPAWMARSGDPFSDRMNSMAKYVVSSTLTDPEWANTTVIGGDAIEAIRRLKAQPGQDIVQYGFGQLSYALLGHGLLTQLPPRVPPPSPHRPRPATGRMRLWYAWGASKDNPLLCRVLACCVLGVT